MKFQIFVFLCVAASLLTMGCSCNKTEVNDPPVVQPTPQPTHEKVVDPNTMPKKEVYEGANKPSDYVPVAVDPKGHIKENSAAEDKHIQKEIDSRNVAEVVNEKHVEAVYLNVHLINFNDSDILQQVVDRIEETSHNNNYKLLREQQPNRKEMRLKLWSELPGPISLEQTLQNSLSDYSLRMEPKGEHQYVIQPK